MSLLEISDLRFNYSDKELFNNASFRLFKDDHMGIVGINGAGKTTLLNLIAKNIKPDNGKIEWIPNLKVGYMDQHVTINKDVSIRDYLYDVFKEMFQKEEMMENLYAKMASAPEEEYDTILTRANQIMEFLEEKGFYAFKSSIGNVISGLGIDESRLDDPLKNLSGGQRAKVILGKLLLMKPDVLIMDEPTNFLDVSHIEWLTKYLVSYPNAFIVVSHDFDFLNDISNVIVELENKVLTRYKGNYEYYLKEKEIRSVTYQKAFENQQKFIKKTEEFINKNLVRASTTKRAQSRRKTLEKLEVLSAPQSEKVIKFTFPFSREEGNKTLEVKNLEVGYTKSLLAPQTFILRKGQKVVITGENGIGKSTTIKTLMEEIPSLGGDFRFADNAEVSYFAQDYSYDKNSTAFQVVKNEHEEYDNKTVRQVLSRVGIGSDLVMKKMSELSGGEQAKVRLCLMTLVKANFLILDEPTNHLDYIAKKALFQGLKEFKGTVLLVSHESEFYKDLIDVEIKL